MAKNRNKQKSRLNETRQPDWQAAVERRVEVSVRERGFGPRIAVAHLGPTNSGKTHDALQRLAERGSGVFAGPLRMLAREAYEKMCDLVGPDKVALLTGEEKINADAPIVCCTAEMAPRQGEVLVLDEAQWAHDPDRGYAWTRLLVGGRYDRIEVAASRGAEPLIRAALSDAQQLEVVEHQRLAPISFAGKVRLPHIPSRSLLVAFSRKAVHALAGKIARSGRGVGVLYGALPPDARVDQIDRFKSGEYDILVTTDVVGQGVNVPADNVVFAESTKFDGTVRRPLHLWEATQIAGRAGRYGLSESGNVYALAGQPGFGADKRLIERASLAAGGHIPDELHVEEGLLRPTYTDLGEPAAPHLAVALQAWQRQAQTALRDKPGVRPVEVAGFVERWEKIRQVLGHRDRSQQWAVGDELVWRIITLPLNLDSPVFVPLVRDLRGTAPVKVKNVLNTLGAAKRMDLGRAESAAATARDVMVIAQAFDEFAELAPRAARAEREYAARAAAMLDASVRSSTHGVCADCGDDCAPWFERCDECHQSQFDRDFDDYGWSYHSRYESTEEDRELEREQRAAHSEEQQKLIEGGAFEVGQPVVAWYGERTGVVVQVNKVTVKVRMPSHNNGGDLIERNLSPAYLEELPQHLTSLAEAIEAGSTCTVKQAANRSYQGTVLEVDDTGALVRVQWELKSGKTRDAWVPLQQLEARQEVLRTVA